MKSGFKRIRPIPNPTPFLNAFATSSMTMMVITTFTTGMMKRTHHQPGRFATLQMR